MCRPRSERRRVGESLVMKTPPLRRPGIAFSEREVRHVGSSLGAFADHREWRGRTASHLQRLRWRVFDPDAWLERDGASVRAVVTGTSWHHQRDDAAPSLAGLVAIAGVGFARVDLEMARARGSRVTNMADVLTEDVADFALGLISRRWDKSRPGTSTSGMVAGQAVDGACERSPAGAAEIIGLGHIGQAIARRLQGFGGSIAYADVKPQTFPLRFIPRWLTSLALPTS